MPSTISDILSSFTTDLARPNRFEVLITPPLVFDGADINLLAYRCEVAQLPGRHLSTIEQKSYGPFEKFPFHTSYGDIDLTFILDGDMGIKNFFDAWVDYINPVDNNNVSYKDSYTTDIVINQYDVSNEKTYSVTLVNAFPMNVNQLDLDWSSDGHHKLTVTFAYTYWFNSQFQNGNGSTTFSGTVYNSDIPSEVLETGTTLVSQSDSDPEQNYGI